MQSLNAGGLLYRRFHSAAALIIFHSFMFLLIIALLEWCCRHLWEQCKSAAIEHLPLREKKTLEMWPAGLCKHSTSEVNKQHLYLSASVVYVFCLFEGSQFGCMNSIIFPFWYNRYLILQNCTLL